ncbi:helix-turn-helix domain-containing protein [Hymenobacter sp.]|uniref:helix-turn-helix domain-containing protein n=1 Tax=Hymenobacter sp. TaxID=1898978 RepID=UPI00286A590A|nr:helix-turn-helix domain-containing protein [Hymenobacter sp.]
MRYHEISPEARLAAYINCFWVLDEVTANAAPDPVFPDGSLELLVYLRGASERVTLADGVSAGNPRLEIAGQMTRPYGIRWAPGVCLVGVRFFPHTFAHFLPPGLPVHELNDLALEAEAVLGASFRAVAHQLADCAHPAEAVARLQAYFLTRLRHRPPPTTAPYLDFAVPYILAGQGHADLDALLRKLGIGGRHLERLFGQAVGVSPKHFCRIIRFQQAFRWLARAESLTAVATACGYYDQAHFIRDFRHFTGTTPSAFRRGAGSISAAFLAETSSSYLYNFRE